MLSYRVFISCLGGKNEKYTGCYYSIGIAVNRRLLSQCGADIGWAIGRLRIRAGTKQVDMGNDTFAQFYPAVGSDAGRAAGENYDTRSIDEMKDLFETERIEEIKK